MNKIDSYTAVDVNDCVDITKVEPGILYRISPEKRFVFLCPCGCGSEYWSRIKEGNDSPSWNLEIENTIPTVTPSVLCLHGCQSHFWITNGKVVWS